MKIGTGIDSDPAFVSNKDWDSGNNNGWNMAAKDNSWDLNFADTTRLDIDFDLENIYDNFWHNVGFSLDRSAPGVTNDSITVFTDNSNTFFPSFFNFFVYTTYIVFLNSHLKNFWRFSGILAVHH